MIIILVANILSCLCWVSFLFLGFCCPFWSLECVTVYDQWGSWVELTNRNGVGLEGWVVRWPTGLKKAVSTTSIWFWQALSAGFQGETNLIHGGCDKEMGWGRKAAGEDLLSSLGVPCLLPCLLGLGQRGRRDHSRWSTTKLGVRLGNWNLKVGGQVKIAYLMAWPVWPVGFQGKAALCTETLYGETKDWGRLYIFSS